MAWHTNLSSPPHTDVHTCPPQTCMCVHFTYLHCCTCRCVNLRDAHLHAQTDMAPRPEDAVMALPGSLYAGQDGAGRGWEVRRGWLAGILVFCMNSLSTPPFWGLSPRSSTQGFSAPLRACLNFAACGPGDGGSCDLWGFLFCWAVATGRGP